ncbi:MAG: sirohydrochlorin cobaltochelatase [Selenomonadaceae bacterium]|nr:sirohydrochlorin cobaltochelatase [Selenomonadaceae bacterium]
MRNWKKLLVASLACSAMLGVSAPSADAAYQLNPEVRTATPALVSAAQIGVLKYENPDMRNLENKDAIVVMSFGTTYKETREKTIEATVADIQAAHPGVKVVTAFTSHIIIDRIKKNEGISYPTPEEALAKLKAEGYTRVALVSLDVIPGMEYAYNRGVFDNCKADFKKMTLGTSLMYWQGQEEQADDVADFIEALSPQFKKLGKKEAVLLLAHGTPQPANAYYSVIQAKLAEKGYNNVYVYTVEGWPSLETVIPKLKKDGVSKVTLIPIMMVAGDHANNDMAGDEEDSHKSILQNEGFQVEAYLHGLGENKAIRDLYVARANDAWDALEAK